MICSSVNRFRFVVSSPPSFYRKTHSRSGPFYGGEVKVVDRSSTLIGPSSAACTTVRGGRIPPILKPPKGKLRKSLCLWTC